ncbi:MAG: ABC transporter substrate-binding protein [Paracoccaceae bacterium]|nr:ABC transporter substrate-binding protein [Paracoccaceae bacterium]
MLTPRTSLVVLALSAALTGTAGAAPLVYCAREAPEGFDPALYADRSTFIASSRQIYDRLVDFAPGTTAPVPGLAESWTVSDDGLKVTFTLRSGVAFHANEGFTPTRALNADDVVFSFERQRLEDHPYHAVSGGTWDYFAAMSLPALIGAVEKVDDRTVTFVLTRPDAPFIGTLAMDFASILSAEYADAMAAAGTPERLDTAPIGTGPFALIADEDTTTLRFAAHGEHWGGAPAIETLVFDITPDAGQRAEKLAAGACHAMADPRPEDIAALEGNAEIGLLRQPGLDIGYLAYNTRVPPFDNPAVRRALNMGLNRQGVVEAVFGGRGQLAETPLPPGMWAHDATAAADPFDPERAREMLAAEGADGLTMTLWAMPIRRPYNPDARRMAELFAADLGEIGVEVEIVSYDWPEYLKRSREIDREGAVLFGWSSANGDPDTIFGELLGCEGLRRGNRAQWCHEEFDRLVAEARSVSDPATRAALYAEAQAIFLDEAPWATIAHSVELIPVRREVEGLAMDAFGGPVFKEASFAE